MSDPTDRPSEADALAHTHAWFEVNSGWAPPDPETLIDWAAEGIGRAPDDCWVGASGTCEHGLLAWSRVLAALKLTDDHGDAAGAGDASTTTSRSR